MRRNIIFTAMLVLSTLLQAEVVRITGAGTFYGDPGETGSVSFDTPEHSGDITGYFEIDGNGWGGWWHLGGRAHVDPFNPSRVILYEHENAGGEELGYFQNNVFYGHTNFGTIAFPGSYSIEIFHNDVYISSADAPSKIMVKMFDPVIINLTTSGNAFTRLGQELYFDTCLSAYDDPGCNYLLREELAEAEIAIPFSGSVQHVFGFEANFWPGKYYLRAKADDWDNVEEDNEGNNYSKIIELEVVLRVPPAVTLLKEYFDDHPEFIEAYEVADAVYTVGKSAIGVTCIATGFGGFVGSALLISEVQSFVTSSAIATVLRDPPNPHYNQPTLLKFPALTIPQNDGSVPNPVYFAFIDNLNVERDMASYAMGVLESLEKYQGAFIAEDAYWINIHAKEMEKYLAKYNSSLKHSIKIKQSLYDIMLSESYSPPVIDNDAIAAFKEDLQINGLPQIEKDILASYGYSTEKEQQLLQLHLQFSNDEIPKDYLFILQQEIQQHQQMLDWLSIPDGDINCDLLVDSTDLLQLAEQWLMTDELSADVAPSGGDGYVNLCDYAVAVSQPDVTVNDIMYVIKQWLRSRADLIADISPDNGDGRVDLHDFSKIAANWNIDGPPENIVVFTDAVLESKVRSILGIPEGDITPDDMLGLTNLDEAYSTGITNLTGLEYALNLKRVDLGRNNISDLTPLQNLQQLEYVDIHGNSFTDLSPLGGKNSIKHLDLKFMPQITDYSALSGLVNLEVLDLWDNRVADISFMGNLTALIELNLSKATIVNLAGLENLTALEYLELWYTQVSDISALANHTNLKSLNLAGSPLNDDAYDIYIPLIEANNPGIWIGYDPQ